MNASDHTQLSIEDTVPGTPSSKVKVCSNQAASKRKETQYQLLASKALTRKVSAFYCSRLAQNAVTWLTSIIPMTLEQFLDWSTKEGGHH